MYLQQLSEYPPGPLPGPPTMYKRTHNGRSAAQSGIILDDDLSADVGAGVRLGILCRVTVPDLVLVPDRPGPGRLSGEASRLVGSRTVTRGCDTVLPSRPS